MMSKLFEGLKTALEEAIKITKGEKRGRITRIKITPVNQCPKEEKRNMGVNLKNREES